MRIIENDGTVTEVTSDIASFADGRVVKFETDWKKLRAKIQRTIDARMRAYAPIDRSGGRYGKIETKPERMARLYKEWLRQRDAVTE